MARVIIACAAIGLMVLILAAAAIQAWRDKRKRPPG